MLNGVHQQDRSNSIFTFILYLRIRVAFWNYLVLCMQYEHLVRLMVFEHETPCISISLIVELETPWISIWITSCPNNVSLMKTCHTTVQIQIQYSLTYDEGMYVLINPSNAGPIINKKCIYYIHLNEYHSLAMVQSREWNIFLFQCRMDWSFNSLYLPSIH